MCEEDERRVLREHIPFEEEKLGLDEFILDNLDYNFVLS